MGRGTASIGMCEAGAYLSVRAFPPYVGVIVTRGATGRGANCNIKPDPKVLFLERIHSETISRSVSIHTRAAHTQLLAVSLRHCEIEYDSYLVLTRRAALKPPP